jgi:hypothetical protein
VTTGPDFEKLLTELTGYGVDFIVVGGVAAVLQGAPIMTLDLNILCSADGQNITRLCAESVSPVIPHSDRKP